ncbi:MAG: tetratricopeptide repeat protein [Ignavibacteria bacterium]
MLNNFDKNIEESKAKLDKNYLSPLFIRLANLYYLNEQYDECISVCRSGLSIYPDYLTIKLILVKALLKGEYLNDAEELFEELRYKIPVKEVVTKLRNKIQNLRSISGQEKIHYPKDTKFKYDFSYFEKKFDPQENLFTEFTIEDLLNSDTKIKKESDIPEFKYFRDKFLEFHLKLPSDGKGKEIHSKNNKETDSDIEKQIKIITETLADIYAEQKNYKEAYEAYSFLLRAGSPNSKRIEEKLNDLERNMVKYDSI